MLVIMGERPERGSMIMINKAFLVAFLMGLMSCSSDNFIAELPYATFDDIFINLDLPEYQQLETQGYTYIQVGGGSNGIILYKNNPSDYNAYERTCTFDPFEPTAIIEVTPGGISMVDYNCNSFFGLQEGQPQGGPASVALRQYKIILDGRFLTITDEPIN